MRVPLLSFQNIQSDRAFPLPLSTLPIHFSLVRLGPEDATRATDNLQLVRTLLLENEPIYPCIRA